MRQSLQIKEDPVTLELIQNPFEECHSDVQQVRALAEFCMVQNGDILRDHVIVN